MAFTEDALRQLTEEHGKVEGMRQELQQAVIGHRFATERATEFARHGYLRRVNMLARCITNTFTLLPPERRELPADDARHDAEINLYAFVFNVFGATDNLAWIWVAERNVRKANGAELPSTQVGLRPGNERVRESMPEDFQAYLRNLDNWFGYLEGLRHALAHRIPMYIPPYTITEREAEQYAALVRQQQAALVAGNAAEYGRLKERIEGMASFKPWLASAAQEDMKPVIFHPQLISDFGAVHALGLKLLEQLAAARANNAAGA